MKVITASTAMNSDQSGDNSSGKTENANDKRSFLLRYRLPLFLAVVAVCLYAGSILYILYGRGQV